MPYGQSPWLGASDSVDNVGQSMSRIALAQQMGRQRAQQFAAQQALREAYFQMDQQKQQQGQQLNDARTQQIAAATALAQAKQQQVGQQTGAGDALGFDLNQFAQAQGMSDPSVARSILPFIAQQQGVLAASHPQNIGVQVPQIMESLDPRMRQLIATRTPIMQHVNPEQTLFDAGRGQPVFQGPPRQQQSGRMSPEDQKRMAMMRIYANILSKPGGEAKLPRIQAILSKQLGGGGGGTGKPRVKVRGPNGESGTIEQGDKLPDGWKALQ